MFSQARTTAELNYLSFSFLTHLFKELYNPIASNLIRQLKFNDVTHKFECQNVTAPVKSDGTEFFLEDMKILVFEMGRDYFKQFRIARQLLIIALYNSISREHKKFEDGNCKNNNSVLLKHALQIKMLVKEGIFYLQQLENMYDKAAFTDEFTTTFTELPQFINAKINYFVRVREVFIYEVILPAVDMKNLRASASKSILSHAQTAPISLPGKWIVSATSGVMEELFDYLEYSSYQHYLTFLAVKNPRFTNLNPRFLNPYVQRERIYVLDARNPEEVFQQGIDYHLLETKNGRKVNPFGSVVFCVDLPKAKHVSGQHFNSDNYDSVGGWMLNSAWTPARKNELLANIGGQELPSLRPALR